MLHTTNSSSNYPSQSKANLSISSPYPNIYSSLQLQATPRSELSNVNDAWEDKIEKCTLTQHFDLKQQDKSHVLKPSPLKRTNNTSASTILLSSPSADDTLSPSTESLLADIATRNTSTPSALFTILQKRHEQILNSLVNYVPSQVLTTIRKTLTGYIDDVYTHCGYVDDMMQLSTKLVKERDEAVQFMHQSQSQLQSNVFSLHKMNEENHKLKRLIDSLRSDGITLEGRYLDAMNGVRSTIDIPSRQRGEMYVDGFTTWLSQHKKKEAENRKRHIKKDSKRFDDTNNHDNDVLNLNQINSRKFGFLPDELNGNNSNNVQYKHGNTLQSNQNMNGAISGNLDQAKFKQMFQKQVEGFMDQMTRFESNVRHKLSHHNTRLKGLERKTVRYQHVSNIYRDGIQLLISIASDALVNTIEHGLFLDAEQVEQILETCNRWEYRQSGVFYDYNESTVNSNSNTNSYSSLLSNHNKLRNDNVSSNSSLYSDKKGNNYKSNSSLNSVVSSQYSYRPSHHTSHSSVDRSRRSSLVSSRNQSRNNSRDRGSRSRDNSRTVSPSCSQERDSRGSTPRSVYAADLSHSSAPAPIHPIHNTALSTVRRGSSSFSPLASPLSRVNTSRGSSNTSTPTTNANTNGKASDICSNDQSNTNKAEITTLPLPLRTRINSDNSGLIAKPPNDSTANEYNNNNNNSTSNLHSEPAKSVQSTRPTTAKPTREIPNSKNIQLDKLPKSAFNSVMVNPTSIAFTNLELNLEQTPSETSGSNSYNGGISSRMMKTMKKRHGNTTVNNTSEATDNNNNNISGNDDVDINLTAHDNTNTNTDNQQRHNGDSEVLSNAYTLLQSYMKNSPIQITSIPNNNNKNNNHNSNSNTHTININTHNNRPSSAYITNSGPGFSANPVSRGAPMTVQRIGTQTKQIKSSGLSQEKVLASILASHKKP